LGTSLTCTLLDVPLLLLTSVCFVPFRERCSSNLPSSFPSLTIGLFFLHSPFAPPFCYLPPCVFFLYLCLKQKCLPPLLLFLAPTLSPGYSGFLCPFFPMSFSLIPPRFAKVGAFLPVACQSSTKCGNPFSLFSFNTSPTSLPSYLPQYQSMTICPTVRFSIILISCSPLAHFQDFSSFRVSFLNSSHCYNDSNIKRQRACC